MNTHTQTRAGRATRRALLGAMVATLSTLAMPAFAQRTPPGEIGQTRVNTPINAAKDVGWVQKLDTHLSLDTPFRDESGATVPLRKYFGKRPVVLITPFYKCPGICTQELVGLVELLKDKDFKYKAGRDFDIVTISINPKEQADLARAKKREHMDLLNQPGAETGWHFLTGEENDIRKIAGEVGFKYVYDAKTDQYAHPSGFVVLTPEGTVSRYFFGVAYPARDAKLAVTEAGKGRVGNVVDQFILACYHYDPATGVYGPRIFMLIQVMGSLTVLALGSFMVMAFRKDAKQPRLIATPDGIQPAAKNGKP